MSYRKWPVDTVSDGHGIVAKGSWTLERLVTECIQNEKSDVSCCVGSVTCLVGVVAIKFCGR